MTEALEQEGQLHLMKFVDSLELKHRLHLQNQITSLDLSECCKRFKNCVEMPSVEMDDSSLLPIAKEDCGSISECDVNQLNQLWEIGLEAVAQSEVGVILLAGGQGTRLGVDYPKGMCTVGLPSNKTLFQLQAERILRLQQLARLSYPTYPCLIKWYIMTSSPTDAATKEFFSKHNNFGLLDDQVKYFQQGALPCFTLEGKIILDSKHSLAMAPDGNGGLYKAILKSKLIDDMKISGLKYLHVYCVDNVLVRVADPYFLGFCISRGADCGVKVVEKVDPKEPVGVVCRVKNLGPRVVEYSEISAHVAELRDPLSPEKLAFRAGNICNHFFTVDFLDIVSSRHENDLVYHVAKKKIPFTDDNGVRVKPDKPNGIKMEKFVFDVFEFSKKFVLWETVREDEFSPLKNADAAGKDCSVTCRDDLFRLHAKWVLRAGGTIHSDNPIPVVEISPFLSYGGEDLAKIVDGKTLSVPIHLDPETCANLVNGAA